MFERAEHGEPGTRLIKEAHAAQGIQECSIMDNGKGSCQPVSGSQCWTAHMGLKRCAFPVAITLLPSVGGCVGAVYLRREYRFWYQNLKKPSWCAKHWHFFPTYNVLYPAMGLGSYLVVKEHGFEGPARTALFLYAAQLGLTWLWVPILFKRRCFGMAFVNSVAVTCLSGATLWAFRPLSDTAAALLFPSFLWSVYLMLTSFFILRRNRSGHSPH